MRWRWVVQVVLAGVLLASCSSGRTPAGPATAPSPRPSWAAATTPVPSPVTTTAPTPPSTRPTTTATSPRTEHTDPRWRFFSTDRRRYASPWFSGTHRVMIGYGCTSAPYYAPDPRCPGRQGFHHGIDVAMPCGTRLFSAVHGTVVEPTSPGAPGPAYGPYAFRIRTDDPPRRDVLVGHVRKVYVDPGDVVRPGQLVARANDQGAPDGCHLHLEVRRAGGGLADSVDPSAYLRLTPHR